MTDDERPHTTFDSGQPAASDEYSLTVGPSGPILLQDQYLIEQMANFNRERIPERVVHARGSAAHGFFQCYEPLTDITSAGFLSDPKRKTPVFVRFSTVGGSRAFVYANPDSCWDCAIFLVHKSTASMRAMWISFRIAKRNVNHGKRLRPPRRWVCRACTSPAG